MQTTCISHKGEEEHHVIHTEETRGRTNLKNLIPLFLCGKVQVVAAVCELYMNRTMEQALDFCVRNLLLVVASSSLRVRSVGFRKSVRKGSGVWEEILIEIQHECV